MANSRAIRTARKRTPTGGRVRVCLLVRPKKPPKWWPTLHQGWVTVMGNGRWAAGWTMGIDRRYSTSARTVAAKKQCFLEEMEGLKVGGWEFKTA